MFNRNVGWLDRELVGDARCVFRKSNYGWTSLRVSIELEIRDASVDRKRLDRTKRDRVEFALDIQERDEIIFGILYHRQTNREMD